MKPIHWKKQATGELDLFRKISEDRHPLSEISGMQLDYNTLAIFAHILAKGKYEKFRLFPDNIMLLTRLEHTLVDQGTEKARRKYVEECSKKGITVDFSIFYDKQSALKELYKEMFTGLNMWKQLSDYDLDKIIYHPDTNSFEILT